MLLVIAAFITVWLLAFTVTTRDHPKGEAAGISLVISLFGAVIFGFLPSAMITEMAQEDPENFEITTRERAVVSIRAKDSIEGHFSGFLGVSGIIEGKTVYRYFVETEDGRILPIERDYCVFREEGEVGIERVQIWRPKENFLTKYILIHDLHSEEGYVEITVPKGGVVRNMKEKDILHP